MSELRLAPLSWPPAIVLLAGWLAPACVKDAPAATVAELMGQRITSPLSASSKVKNSTLLLVRDRDGKEKLVVRLDEGAEGQSLDAAMGRGDQPAAPNGSRSAYFELPPCFDVEGFHLKETVGPRTVLPEQVQATVFYRDEKGLRHGIGEIRTTPAVQDPYSRPWVKLWFGADIRATQWDAVLYLDLSIVGKSLFSDAPQPRESSAPLLEAHVQDSRLQPRPDVIRESGLLVLECRRTTPPLESLLKDQYLGVTESQAGKAAKVRVVALDSSASGSRGWLSWGHSTQPASPGVSHEPPDGFEVVKPEGNSPAAGSGDATRQLFFRDSTGQRLLVGSFVAGPSEARVSMASGARLAVTRFDAKILLTVPATATKQPRLPAGPGSATAFDDLRKSQAH
ncbi:MAG: hypothetical protein HY303_07925 [Candidatus Wallbacteria bacterium]|nr:hypothetical protein [Candidatus Wallbacteria bacterium]